MSNWTMDEVNALTSEYGGGNEAALHIWLQNAPGYGQKYRGGVRPREGDRIEHFKQFISDCYDKGMFKATTPFVPSMASTSGAPSPVVAARSVSSGSAGINKLTASSPAKKDYNLFEGSAAGISELSATNSQVSPSISSTDFGNDPFGSHSPFGSSLNLSGKGSQQQPTGQARAPAPFDAFNTSSSQPSDSFASGFDFMSSSGPDPFASTGASQKLGGFDAFDSYSVSSHSSANTPVSQGTGGAPSGFDFMSASDPFSSAPAAATTNSSNNDLFGLSSGIANDVPAPPVVARSTSAPALAPPAAPAPSAMQPAHDPFGSVFLQPTLTPSASAPSLAAAGATGMGMQSNSTKSLPPMGGSSTGMMGNGSMGMGAMNSGMAYGMGMGAGGPSRGPMGAPMGGGMGIGMVMGMGASQGQYNPGSARGSMGNGMMMPGMGAGMQQGMMPGMGMGGGMQQGMMPGMGMSGAMGGGMRGGFPTAAAGMGGSAMMGGVRPQQPAGPGQRMDAIGSAFGGMNLGGPSSAGSSRGGAPPVSNSSNSTASSSFDFIGSNMKQQLGSL